MSITAKHIEAMAHRISDLVITCTEELLEAANSGEVKLTVSAVMRDAGTAAAVRIRIRSPLSVLTEEDQAIIDDRQLALFAGGPKAAGGAK